MSEWDDILHEASFAGVEFPVSKRSVEGGRSSAARKYPFRDGQDLEDTGREPYAIEYEIPLFASIDPIHYPTTYEQLRAVFDDPESQGFGELVDPEIGPIFVKVKFPWRWETTPDERDGGRFAVRFEEVSNDAIVFAIRPDPDAQARLAAEELDASLADAGITDAEILADWSDAGVGLDPDFAIEDTLFVSVVDDFFATLDEGAMAGDEIAANLDVIRTRIDRVNSFSAAREVENWSVVSSSAQLTSSVTEATESKVARAKRIVEYRVPTEMSVYDVANILYGDPGRAGEIEERNPHPSPLFYEAGLTLRVLES